MPLTDREQYSWTKVTNEIIRKYESLDRQRTQQQLSPLPLFVPQDMYDLIRRGLRPDYKYDNYLKLRCTDGRFCHIYPLMPWSNPVFTVMPGGARPEASTFQFYTDRG